MKLAMAQMLVEPGAKERNVRWAEERITQAADAGADLVVLPEAMTLGWTHPAARSESDSVPDGESCARLCAAARKSGILVCSGLIEKVGDRVFNSAVLIDRDGELLLRHRKIHELSIAHDLYFCGDRVNVVDGAFGRIGVMICADGFAPGQVIGRSLGLMGAKLIVSPCAWAVPPDHDNTRDPYGKLWLDNYGPVCREFGLWIAAVSNVGPITAGPWAGRRCIGNSLLIDQEGRERLRGPYGEGADTLLYAELPL